MTDPKQKPKEKEKPTPAEIACERAKKYGTQRLLSEWLRLRRYFR